MASHPDDAGATPRELLLEACRRNNTALFADVLASKPFAHDAPATAHFLNTTTDALGASALHVAAYAGAYDVLDAMLDQVGVEIDGCERREGDTPLHRAVRYAAREREGGRAVVEILLDAGCDARLRNKAKLKPSELVDPRDAELKAVLLRAEFAVAAGSDVVDEDADQGVEGGSESD